MLQTVAEMISFDTTNMIRIIDGANEVNRRSGIPMEKTWGKVGDPANRIHNRLRSTANQLKRKGLLYFPIQGHWSLTLQGLEEARKLGCSPATASPPVDPEAKAPTPDDEPVVDEVVLGAAEVPQEASQPVSPEVPSQSVLGVLGEAKTLLEASQTMCLEALAKVQ